MWSLSLSAGTYFWAGFLNVLNSVKLTKKKQKQKKQQQKTCTQAKTKAKRRVLLGWHTRGSLLESAKGVNRAGLTSHAEPSGTYLSNKELNCLSKRIA